MNSGVFLLGILIVSVSIIGVAEGIGVMFNGETMIYDFFIKFVGDLDVTGFASFKTPLGGFHSDNEVAGDINTTLSDADTMFQIKGMFESSIQVGNGTYFTLDAANGNMTFQSIGLGIWSVELDTSFSTTKTGKYHCWVTLNGTKQEISFQRRISNVNDVGDASGGGHINATSGDVLALECETNSGANPIITFQHMLLKVERVSK